MEDINPTLWMILVVKKSLEQGESVGFALQKMEIECPKKIKPEFLRWKCNLERNESLNLEKIVKSHHRIFIYHLFERGLRGEPIYASLVQLEEEIINACRSEMDEWIGKLPFLLMIPLMLFQFPSLVLITIGPFFLEMLLAIGGQPV